MLKRKAPTVSPWILMLMLCKRLEGCLLSLCAHLGAGAAEEDTASLGCAHGEGWGPSYAPECRCLHVVNAYRLEGGDRTARYRQGWGRWWLSKHTHAQTRMHTRAHRQADQHEGRHDRQEVTQTPTLHDEQPQETGNIRCTNALTHMASFWPAKHTLPIHHHAPAQVHQPIMPYMCLCCVIHTQL